MTRQQLFPAVLIVLDFAASITYGFAQNWRLSIYWAAAAILTICVTF